MSGLNRKSALALIEEMRRIDTAAADTASKEPGADIARISKRLELRQAILAVTAVAIEEGLDEAQAVDVVCGTGTLLMGSACRIGQGGMVGSPVFASMASAVIEYLATAAGVDVAFAMTATPRMSSPAGARAASPAPAAPETSTRH